MGIAGCDRIAEVVYDKMCRYVSGSGIRDGAPNIGPGHVLGRSALGGTVLLVNSEADAS